MNPANPIKPEPINRTEAGSGVGVPGVPGKNVSGPVPNENVTSLNVVASVTPVNNKVKEAGPIVYGLCGSNPGFVFP